jgi:hypothetical protein
MILRIVSSVSKKWSGDFPPPFFMFVGTVCQIRVSYYICISCQLVVAVLINYNFVKRGEAMHRRSNILVTMIVAVSLVGFLTGDLWGGDYMIDHYEFGKIVVNGQDYEHDIVILPDGSIHSGPEDMHYVLLPELEQVINTPGIKILLIGTGAEGNGLLRKKLVKVVKGRGIKLEMMLTKDAVKMMNETSREGLVAMLHLNC